MINPCISLQRVNFRRSGSQNPTDHRRPSDKSRYIYIHVFYENYYMLKQNKQGEVFGWFAFMTEQKRQTSIQSLDFSTVYEIKKADFLDIIKANSPDYVRNFILFYFFFFFFLIHP